MTLEENLVDFIYEQQIKLGYSESSVGLYYPLDTLNKLLDVEQDADGMMECLAEFAVAVENRLGNITFSHSGDRFCINIPPKGSKYVYENVPQNAFLVDFIKLIGRHGCSIEQVKKLFEKYDENYIFEEIVDDDFDYCLYFNDGENSQYRYLLKDEGIHLTYHRFTIEDYKAIINA